MQVWLWRGQRGLAGFESPKAACARCSWVSATRLTLGRLLWRQNDDSYNVELIQQCGHQEAGGSQGCRRGVSGG